MGSDSRVAFRCMASCQCVPSFEGVQRELQKALRTADARAREIFNSCLEYLNSTDGAHNVTRGGIALMAWGSQFKLVDLSKGPSSRLYAGIGCAEKVINGVVEFPRKAKAFVESLSLENKSWIYALRDVMVPFSDIWDAGQTVVEMCLTLSVETAWLVTLFGGAILASGMGCAIWQVVEDCWKILQDCKALQEKGEGESIEMRTLQSELINEALTIGLLVSYFLLGTLIVATAFYAIPMASVAMLVCATGVVFFGVAAHFHKVNAVQPLFNSLALDKRVLYNYCRLKT